MRRHPIESTSLASVGYDRKRRQLEVEFRTGHVYDYFEVPRSVYDEFRRAPSKGRFFTSAVRDRFPYQKVS